MCLKRYCYFFLYSLFLRAIILSSKRSLCPGTCKVSINVHAYDQCRYTRMSHQLTVLLFTILERIILPVSHTQVTAWRAVQWPAPSRSNERGKISFQIKFSKKQHYAICMCIECVHIYLCTKHSLHRLQELVAVVCKSARIFFKHTEQRACLKHTK